MKPRQGLRVAAALCHFALPVVEDVCGQERDALRYEIKPGTSSYVAEDHMNLIITVHG